MYLVIFCYWVGPVPYLELFGAGPVEKNTLYIADLYIKKQIYSTGSNEKCANIPYNGDSFSVELLSFFPLKLTSLQGVWKGRDHFHLESLCLLLAKTADVARRTTEGGELVLCSLK